MSPAEHAVALARALIAATRPRRPRTATQRTPARIGRAL